MPIGSAQFECRAAGGMRLYARLGVVADVEVGLYDQVIDLLMSERLSRLADGLAADVAEIEPAEAADRVAEVVANWVRAAVAASPAAERGVTAERVARAVLDALQPIVADVLPKHVAIAQPLRRLAAVESLDPLGATMRIGRPLTPLRDTVLMTNGRDQPSLLKELQAEIESADRIDLILAFIRWTGIRDLIEPLRRRIESGVRVRVITTTYTGSTEARALEALTGIGAEVHVSFDTGTTRLHAKAWHFHRESGFSTAYIGSSNLTFSAQVTGLEWNVRTSQPRNRELIEAFRRTFDTYWADVHFEPYDPDRFAEATARARAPETIDTPFDITPLPFQRHILERLDVERSMGHANTLIVAATGTGKTVVSALDYKRLRSQLQRSRLLFVAHRDTILQQSMTTFRHVLRDGAFGELWVGEHRPQRWDHVFASIQSVSAAGAASIRADQFDIVIVDEFHHAAASTYEALLDHVRPAHLIGLTATPERTDGLDILRWFGGRTAVEIRLWDALEQGLLSPFHYYGIHDGTDLSSLTWRRGSGYDTGELTNLYTADDMRVGKVLAAVRDRVGDPSMMRALGFCVSVEHARYMARKFEQAGFRAQAITGVSSETERRSALGALRDGRLNVIFAVDLLNEGVDVPAVDVVMMLRPTESATVFMQQLGRGLRRSEGKDVLTVLDFVGGQTAKFRFDLRYRHLLGVGRQRLQRDVQQDFPYLPAGCSMQLDPVAKDIVLRNLREALPSTWPRQVGELRALGDIGIGEYLSETGLDLVDIYATDRTFTEMRRSAGLLGSGPEGEAAVGRGLGRLLHVDDVQRIDCYRALLGGDNPPRSTELDERRRRSLEGLLLTLLAPRGGQFGSLDHAVDHVWAFDDLRREAMDLLGLLRDRIDHLHVPAVNDSNVPLQVHGTYRRDEVLAALAASRVAKPARAESGVHWVESAATDLFFVTLQKSDRDYSPTTRYLDYAISDSLFHWETQSTTSISSPTGKRYLNGTNTKLLFVRKAKRDERGRTAAYLCVGPLSYVEHRSDRPIQITWRLARPLPGDTFADYRAAIA